MVAVLRYRKITGEDALGVLQHRYGFPEAQARRILNIAWEFTHDAEPVPGGLIRIEYHGFDETTVAPRPHIFSISEDIGPARKRGLAESTGPEYPVGKNTSQRREPRKKGHEMARTAAAAKPATGRGRARPAPEPEQNGDMNDEERGQAAQRYLTKPFTPTMEDYVEWFETYVSPLADLRRDLPRILVLGIQLYGLYFQKSPFNRERTAERRAERTAEPAQAAPAANGRGRGARPATASTKPAAGTSRGRGRTAAAAKDEPATPARRGRPPKAATETAKPATPARRGRPPKAAAETKPATGRGRGRGTAAASKDAPF